MPAAPHPPVAPAPAGPADRVALLSGAAVLALGLGLVAALLADLQDTFGFPTWGLGLIAGISYAAGFGGHLGLGGFADRGFLRLMLVGGAFAGTVALVWLAVATELWQFVAARALFGLAEGAFLPAARRLVLTWRPDRPGAELGSLLGAAMTGFVVGPIAGGLLAEAFGLRVAFLAPAAALAATFPVLLRIPIVEMPRRRTPGPLALLGRPLVRAAVLLGGAEFFMIGGLEAIWARLVTDRGASTAEVGLTLTVVVLPVALLTPAAGRLADRIDPARQALGAVAVLVLAVPLLGVVETVLLTVAVGTVHGILSGITAPAAQALVSRESPAAQVATGQGLLEGIGLLLAAAAALPVGWFYATWGARWLGVGLAVPVAALWVVAAREVRRARSGRTGTTARPPAAEGPDR